MDARIASPAPTVISGLDGQDEHTNAERPSKRLKLTVRKPNSDIDKIDANGSRPKRKSARPARFSEDAITTSAGRGPNPLTRTMETPVANSPASVKAPESESYSANFLMNYLVDDPPDASPAPKQTESPPDSHHEEASIPKAMEKPSTMVRKSETPAIFDQPLVHDTPEEGIKKLSVAVHALGALNLPTIIRPLIDSNRLSSSDHEGRESSEQLQNSKKDSPAYRGVPDGDMRLIIHHAIQLLRGSMVNKVQIQRTQNAGKPKARAKRDVGIAALIEADKFALSGLEAVSRSSVLNINCILTTQRANLIWHLYMSLLYMLVPPPMMQMHPPPQQMAPPMGPHGYLPHGAMEAAYAANHAHSQSGSPAQPPPHQFLFRDQQNGGPPNGPMHGPPGMPYPPEYLPRSGQSMRFSFQPPIPSSMSPHGMPHGFSPNGPVGMIASPGAARSPSLQLPPSGFRPINQ